MSDRSSMSPDPAVTVVISRRVKPGCEAEFEAFLTGVTHACRQFPGHLGSTIFRPVNTEDPEYRVIFKFDRLSHLRRWETSEERQQWFATAEPLTQHPPTIQVLSGLETWFTLPGKPTITPPPRYKMVLVTWITVFPLITTISALLQSYLSPLPLVLRVMIVTGIAVPTLTYFLMPCMTRLFAGWLYPSTLDTCGSETCGSDLLVEQPDAVLPTSEAIAVLPLPELQPMPQLEVEVSSWAQLNTQ